MVLPKLAAPTLTRLPVTINGAWLDGPPRDFRGHATAAEPLVAVAFAKQSKVHWAKSDRPASDGSLTVRLLLGRYDRDSLDVQVNFSIGGGHALGRTVLRNDAPPTIEVPMHLETACIVPFVTVEGSATVELYGLFVARSDVRIGRNGLWNLKPQHRESVVEPYLSVLTYGRNGELMAA